jgi:hypothetical protein
MLKNVLIGTNVSYPTAITNPSQLTAGQIGVFSVAADGTYSLISSAISPAQALLPVVIAQGVPAGRNIKMFTIQPGEKKAYLYTDAGQPIPNVFVTGYDGVTATYALPSGIAGTYDFKVQNLTYGNPPFPTVGSTPFFQTNAAATQIAIASAIVKDVNNQFLLSNNDVMPAQRFAFAEILSGASSAQLVTSAPANITGTFTVGSTNVTLSGSTAGGTTVLNIGDYLRVGNATATTAPIYRVATVSGTAVTLDTPYVNSMLTVGTTIASVALGYVTAANAIAGNAGIRVTETGNIFNGSSVLEPMPNKILNVSCNVNLSGAPVQNNQVVTKTYTAANGTIVTGVYTEGTGTYPQIFKKELTAAGYSGFINRIFLPDNFPLYSVSGTSYVTIGLQYGTSVTDYTAQGYKAGETLSAIIAGPSGSQIFTLATILSSTDW